MVKIVDSWALNKIDYNKKSETLTITMQPGIKGRGAVLTYSDVPENVYKAFLKAPSKGEFFNREIRNEYVYS